LLLDGFDAKDIDRLIGAQPPREGITGQRDPETGAIVPILVADEATGQPVPLTTGLFLKKNAGEILDNDVSFGLRPSEATERMATAGFWAQHGIISQLADLGLPGRIIAPAFLQTFGEGSALADTAEKAKVFFEQQEQQEQAAAEAASEQGVVNFMHGLAQSDFDKASQLMEAISQAVLGSQQGRPPQIAQMSQMPMQGVGAGAEQPTQSTAVQ
ncbi:MAG TPA: hypothetical protein VIM84_09520, partial [Gemmatimonadales bacterium]